MNKILTLLIIVSLSVLWPFSCTAQINGNLPNDDSCDTIFIENPAWDAERETFNQMIARLTGEVEDLTSQNQVISGELVTAEAIIVERDNTILALNQSLEEALNKPADTVYVDNPVPVMPSPTVDTVFVSHSNDDKTNRKFFHHGSFDAPYPKDITFETKELCMITVEFPDSLGTYRLLDQFKVKRIMDHENARTIYQFIE